MNKLKTRIENHIKILKFDENFSLSVVVLKNEKQVFKFHYGKRKELYDLASMTKSIFTGLYFLEKKLNKKKVNHFLPWIKDQTISVGELLSHSSGLRAHEKFYLYLIKIEDKKEKPFYFKKQLQNEALFLKSQKPTYSDIGYLLLGEVIKEVELNDDLNAVFENLKKEYKLDSDFHFNSNNKPKFSKHSYAPTELCKWRNKKLQGQVFDDNAYALGGVAAHAGLFGSLSSMANFGSVLRRLYFKDPAAFKKACEGWSHGFMVPSGSASTAGSYFSKYSRGHLGFTGTSFWFDPKADLYVSILSNRTYPDRADTRFNALRPLIHDLIFKEFVDESAQPRSL